MYKVLIVDDEGNIREGIKRNCRWEEYKISQVMTASNGLEALKIMEDFKPDIVFTDIKMPIINGLDFLRISSERYQNCLFVVLSGYDDFDFARSAMKYNAKEYILKPVSVNEIHDVLAKLVAQLEVQRQGSLREEKYRLLVRMKESEAIRDYIIGKSDDVEMKLNDLELFRTERLRLLIFDLSNGTDDVRDACSLLETYFDARRLLFLCDVVDDTLLVCI